MTTYVTPPKAAAPVAPALAIPIATGIALKHGILVGGIPVVNTPILGAIPKILDRVTLKSLQEVVKGKWKAELASKNVKATHDAFDEVEVNS